MSQVFRAGKHWCQFIEPDVVYMVYDGDINKEEGRRLSEWFSEYTDGKDARFVVDIRALGNMPADARKELGAQRRPPRTDRDYKIDLAFVGASLRTKVLMTVVVAAATLASNQKLKTHYFADRDAAIAWAGIEAAALG